MSAPALPILGSSLLQITKDRAEIRKRKRVGTAFDPIDSALRGGIDYGRICCLSGDKRMGKTTISTHILVTHLLSSPNAQAAVIDTTGTFDVLRLHEIILSRVETQNLTARARQIGNQDPQDPEAIIPLVSVEEVEKTADKVLERVKILRVFDFVGVVEAVNELSEELQIKPSEETSESLKPVGESLAPEKPPEPQCERKEIADSDEEDEGMLFDSPSPVSGKQESAKEVETFTTQSQEKIGMIVVDNISQVVNPILKTNYVRGQSFLATFLRSLKNLTKSNDIATVLINAAVSPKSTYNIPNTSINPPQSTWIQDPTSAPPSFLDQPSIFASTTVRPALGKGFTYHIDLHLLLGQLPKRRRDAEIAFGGKAGKGEFVNVIEVLADRWDGRLGLWAAFAMGKGVKLEPAF